MPPVKSVCSLPSSSANAKLPRYPGPPAMPPGLTPFFESAEIAPLMTGMLSRRIHPPFGFSGRSWIGASGGRMSRGDGAGMSRALYLDAEHASQPQYGAWSAAGELGWLDVCREDAWEDAGGTRWVVLWE